MRFGLKTLTTILHSIFIFNQSPSNVPEIFLGEKKKICVKQCYLFSGREIFYYYYIDFKFFFQRENYKDE